MRLECGWSPLTSVLFSCVDGQIRDWRYDNKSFILQYILYGSANHHFRMYMYNILLYKWIGIVWGYVIGYHVGLRNRVSCGLHNRVSCGLRKDNNDDNQSQVLKLCTCTHR